MGILKDILVGGAAWKALKRSDRPGVFPPSGYTVLGMEHIGMGRTWKIIYCKNKNPNIKKERPENIIKMKSNFIKKILTHKDQLLVTNTKGKMRVKI